MRLHRITWRAECVEHHAFALTFFPQIVGVEIGRLGAFHGATEATVDKCGNDCCGGEISAVFGYGPAEAADVRATHHGCGVRQ